MTSSSGVHVWFGPAGRRRSIAPTARGWIALVALAGLTTAAAVAPSPAGVALDASIAVALGGALLSIALVCWRGSEHLHATLSGPKFVPRGKPASLELVLVGDVPAWGCRIGFDRSSARWGRVRADLSPDRHRASNMLLAPQAGKRLQVNAERSSGSQIPGLAVPTSRRGIYACRGTALWMYDPLGMFGTRLVTFPDLSVVVHPFPVGSHLAQPIPGLGQQDGSSAVVGATTSAGGVDLLGVRPYQLGDRLSSLHWRSFTSTTPLLVRELGTELVNPVRLIIDDRAGVHRRAAFETALDLLTGAVADRPRVAPSLEVRSLASGHALTTSGGTMPALLRWLAALEPRRADRPGLELSRTGWVVGLGDTVITTSTGSASLSALRDQGARVVVAG